MEYSMYTYILVCTCTCSDVQTKNSMYWYVLVCTDHVIGFRGKHGVGVRNVQRGDACPLLSFWHAKETFSWFQYQGISIYLEYFGTYVYVLVCTLMYFVCMRRTLWLLSHRILTVSRRIIMMFPWKTVGLLVTVPSCFSSAICVLRMEGSQRTVHTKLVQVHTSMHLYVLVYTLAISYQMISCANLYSSTPLRSWICLSRDLWRTRG